MSRKENDDFIATKAEKTFDDDGNIKVADVDKKTTVYETLPKGKRGYVGGVGNKKPYKIKQIILDNSAEVIKFKKR